MSMAHQEPRKSTSDLRFSVLFSLTNNRVADFCGQFTKSSKDKGTKTKEEQVPPKIQRQKWLEPAGSGSLAASEPAAATKI